MLENFFKPIVNLDLIRVGPYSDGGYFVPKKVIKISKTLISCGLGFNWKFEKDLVSLNKKIEIIVFDHTVNYFSLIINSIKSIFFSLRFRKNFREIFKIFEYFFFFRKKKIFHLKKRVFHKEKSKKDISISKILKNQKKIILKIDIEGDEYNILKDIKKFEKDILCLIIEFHDIKKNKLKIKKFIDKSSLLNCNICPNNSSGFDNQNNPKTVEITFINNQLVKKDELNNKIRSKCVPNNLYKKNFKIIFKKT